MRCEYSCGGCYSRGRPTGRELSTAETDALLAEAERLGILAVVVTGGEPFLRDDILDLLARHRRLLFVLITNGSLVTSDVAGRIARSGNVIPVVSIEGFPRDTDERRHEGAHEAALRAIERLREAGACFGFAAMNTAANTAHLGSDRFIDGMIARGCALGFFTEYVPCDPSPRADWVLSEEDRAAFRKRVLALRARKPIVLVQFPQDEYGPQNVCTAAGRASFHVSAEGAVEPCPFVALSCENVRDGGLAAACRSPFLAAIRGRPALLRREQSACALFEHRAEVEALARELAAARDSRSPNGRTGE
jgi:MoaA/NifB/PqqE/SkfB family radical SAM enzyme